MKRWNWLLQSTANSGENNSTKNFSSATERLRKVHWWGSTVEYFPQFCVLLECKKLPIGKNSLHYKSIFFQTLNWRSSKMVKLKYVPNLLCKNTPKSWNIWPKSLTVFLASYVFLNFELEGCTKY